MNEFSSFSEEFLPSHETVHDLVLRDYLHALVPESSEQVVTATYDTDTKSIDIEFERIPGCKPTFYVDIREHIGREDWGIRHTVAIDDETGYVFSLDLDLYGVTAPLNPEHYEMTSVAEHFRMIGRDLASAVTKDRVDEVRKEIEALCIEA